jgi:RNA polymerase sigma factor (sigma-70 family)
VEASTIPATAVLASGRSGSVPPARLAAGPLLRLRSDEQLVRHFRAGSEEAFRVVHDRYRPRLLAYARQMLGGSRADAEDVLQDVFVRAYRALRANDRDVSLRAWLYRIAHNRCIDELRRPGDAPGAPAEALELIHAPASDPMAAVEQRESLRRLVEDVQRLPEQQRSALLMREISGMAYQDLATVLDVTVPAVKSLLVRARIGLAQAAEARDTACVAIRADLADAHERGVRASGLARRHMHDCRGCRAYRRELRALDVRLAALVPAVGPAALIAKLLGIGGGAAAGGGAAGGAAAAAAGVGAAAAGAGGASVGMGHIAAVVAVAVVGAGGAVEVQRSLAPERHPAAVHRAAPADAAAALLAPSVGAAALLPAGHDAATALSGDAGRRLRLRIAPPAAPPPAAALDVDGAGNGGAAAPVDPALEPVVPEAAPPQEGAAGDDAEGTTAGATSGATDVSTSPPTEPSTAPEPAPAASTAPSPAAPPAPPTSASTGGATYPG